MQGKVKWFDGKKGYGFISPAEGGKDVFVHFTGIKGTGFRGLAEADDVTFDVQQGVKGPQAVNVERMP